MSHNLENDINSPNVATQRFGTDINKNENPQDYSQTDGLLKSRIPIPYKIVVALLFIVGYTIYRIFYVKFDNSVCIQDAYFNATWNANRWMKNSSANVIIGIGQIIMDSWIIFAGVAWFVLVKNMRFPLAAGLMFLFRSFFLSIEKFPFDDYIVWHSPGFLSFTVPYDHTRDFFFSGHTGSLSIVMFEMLTLRWYAVGAFTFINLLFMMNMLIISRVHYTIDVMAGLIFATVSYRLTVLILKYLDYLLSIPFYIGRFIYYKIRKGNKQKQYEPISAPETEQVMRNAPAYTNF